MDDTTTTDVLAEARLKLARGEALEVKHCAALVPCSLPTMYEEVNSGRCRSRRVGKKGGKILISSDNFKRWLDGDAA